MLGKSELNTQLNLMEVPLLHFIDPSHELCRLAKKIDWHEVEKDFAMYYSKVGAPSVPLKTIVGLTILKQVYGESERTAIGRWLENPYWQHFCGEVYFQNKSPFYFSDFGHFRKRIGTEGMDKLLSRAVNAFDKQSEKAFRTSSRRSGKKEQGFLNKMIFRVGNYLTRISSH